MYIHSPVCVSHSQRKACWNKQHVKFGVVKYLLPFKPRVGGEDTVFNKFGLASRADLGGRDFDALLKFLSAFIFWFVHHCTKLFKLHFSHRSNQPLSCILYVKFHWGNYHHCILTTAMFLHFIPFGIVLMSPQVGCAMLIMWCTRIRGITNHVVFCIGLCVLSVCMKLWTEKGKRH